MSNKKKPKKGASSGLSKLAEHSRSGKRLLPPFARLSNVQLTSWINERLPDFLWLALVHETLGRENGLAVTREVAGAGKGLQERKSNPDLTLSGLAALPIDARQAILAAICGPGAARIALRPMLMFENLPAREDWVTAIDLAPEDEDWETLARAVEAITDHQSERATDLRWARMLFKVLAGQAHLSGDYLRNTLGYPNVGDLTKVRPFIRASELAFANSPNAPPDGLIWSGQFWDTCMRETDCAPMEMEAMIPSTAGVTTAAVRQVGDALALHALATRATTATDPKHEAVFGLALYALALTAELLRFGNANGIMGRLGLRSLVEVDLLLNYLVTKDTPETWLAYRNYGSGQAKLAYLKLDDPSVKRPEFVNVDLLKALANEDRWQEYQDINLGHWDGSDLRKMSEVANRKDLYDRVYAWTSAFTHGTWSAVRASSYDLCVNPLHRWHRVLRNSGAALDDAMSEAATIANDVLSAVDHCYPPFASRFDT